MAAAMDVCTESILETKDYRGRSRGTPAGTEQLQRLILQP